MKLLRVLAGLFLIMQCNTVLASGTKGSLKPTAPSSLQLDRDTIVIRFEYKQSALYQPYTFEVLDSVIAILKGNDSVTLTIEGYAHINEGNDTVCKYLSLNRALFVRDYVLGRGISAERILSIKGYGNTRPLSRGTDGQGLALSCRAEIKLNYPEVKKIVLHDRDGDGIADEDDKCPDEFGYTDNNGCPDRDAVLVPFEAEQSSLYSAAYRVLDSVVSVIKDNPTCTISIEGHAYKSEGSQSLCDRVAGERADIVRDYLLSRGIGAARIGSLKSYSNRHPLNAGNNPEEIARNSRAQIIFSKSPTRL